METCKTRNPSFHQYGLFTNDYKEFLLPEAMNDNIDVYYEAPTGQLVLGQTDVQGGLVVLYGDMLSTGTRKHQRPGRVRGDQCRQQHQLSPGHFRPFDRRGHRGPA